MLGTRLERFAVYRFRWLLYELVLRDLKLRYRGSVFGFAWTLLNPLLFMAVYTLVFSVFMRSGIRDYPLFLMSGLVPWLWFSVAITQSVTCIIDGSAYIGKTLMPAELLVLVPVLSNGVNFLITIMLLLPVCAALGVNVVWAITFLPVLVAIELVMTLGISMLVAALNVFYRDFQQIISYVLTAAFFLTPIFYQRSAIPANMQSIMTFDPLTGLMTAYQNIFYRGEPPNATDLLSAGVFAALVLLLGVAYFKGARDSLGEYV